MRVLRASLPDAEGFRVHLVESEWDALVTDYVEMESELIALRTEHVRLRSRLALSDQTVGTYDTRALDWDMRERAYLAEIASLKGKQE